MARKGWENERLRNAVLDKCWQFLKNAMNGDKATFEQKLDIAKSLACKSMPTTLANPDGSPLTVNNLWVENDRKPKEKANNPGVAS